MTVPLREVRRARLRRQRLLALLLLAGALALVVVLLFTVGPFAAHLDRPGKPPLGYLRAPLGGRQYRVSAWTLGSVASLEAATAARAVDEVDFDWYHAQADGAVTAENENLDLVAAARESGLNIFATVTNTRTRAAPSVAASRRRSWLRQNCAAASSTTSSRSWRTRATTASTSTGRRSRLPTASASHPLSRSLPRPCTESFASSRSPSLRRRPSRGSGTTRSSPTGIASARPSTSSRS